MMQTRYTVEVLHSGQDRPYANTVNEYRVTCEMFRTWGLPPERDKWHPWLMFGDIDATKAKEIQDERSGRCIVSRSGTTRDEYFAGEKRRQLEWAKKIVKTLCQNFFEQGEDGANWASPMLNFIHLDAKAGTINARITEAYTD